MTVLELLVTLKKGWLVIVVAAALGATGGFAVWSIAPVPVTVSVIAKVSQVSLLTGDQLTDIKQRYGVSFDFIDGTTLKLSATSSRHEWARANIQQVLDYLDRQPRLHTNARASIAQDLLDQVDDATAAIRDKAPNNSPFNPYLDTINGSVASVRDELAADLYVHGTQRMTIARSPRNLSKTMLAGLAYGVLLGCVATALTNLWRRRKFRQAL